jgi:hypothetical protein
MIWLSDFGKRLNSGGLRKLLAQIPGRDCCTIRPVAQQPASWGDVKLLV